MTINQIVLAVAGTPENGQTTVYAQVVPNLAPKGSYTLNISTTYNKARNPEGHQTKLSLYLQDADAVNKLAKLLTDSVQIFESDD